MLILPWHPKVVKFDTSFAISKTCSIRPMNVKTMNRSPLLETNKTIAQFQNKVKKEIGKDELRYTHN